MDTMLGKIVRMIVTVPAEWLGTLCDLLEKITGKDGSQWFAQLKPFLRKEPCWKDGEAVSIVEPAPAAEPAPQAEPAEKFALLVDLGIVEVPADYDHATAIAKFLKNNRKKFYKNGVNENISDANFPSPTRVMKPGDKFRVRAFKQIVRGSTTSVERMAFLEKQNAVHTGAQGSAVVFEQKRDQLPKGYWYASFDQPDRLWKDADGYHRVPDVSAYSDGGFLWYLGYFEHDWLGAFAFLCFCDLEPESSGA